MDLRQTVYRTLLLTASICFLACTSCTSGGKRNAVVKENATTQKDATARKDATLEVLFTGDVLLDRGVRPVLEAEGMDSVFAGVNSLFRKADAVVINLECPLTDTVSSLNKKYIFRADAACAEGLKRVGVSHAAMANNHTNDQGRRGLAATHRHLVDAGIVPIGYGQTSDEQLAPAVISKDGLEVAVFNDVLVPLENWHQLDDCPGVCQASCDELADAIREYRKSHRKTWVVAVLHWGKEFDVHPSLKQRMQASRLASAGTDVIIGHHPHVVQDVGTIKTDGVGMCDSTLVYYSLGNFVFDQSAPDTRKTFIVSLRFSADGTLTPKILPVRIEGCKPRLQSIP